MTTIAAIVYPRLKLAAIGADGQVTVGEQVAKLTAKKYTVIGTPGKIGFAFAGSAMAGLAAARLFKDCVNEDADPKEGLLKFQDEIEKFQDPILTKGASGIAVWPEGLYYMSTVDSPLQVEAEVNGALIAAQGSGGSYALGALHAMAMSIEKQGQLTPAFLKSMVRQAIEIGIYHDRNSGGEPSVEVLDGSQQ